MEWYDVFVAFGGATLCSLVVTLIFNSIVNGAKAKQKQQDSLRESLDNDITCLKLGLQALLRAQLIADWNKWSEKGYAPIYAKENFENCYRQYHTLGANGVMDSVRECFLALPTEKPEKKSKKALVECNTERE